MGSAKGVVEWWTPGIGTPAVKLFVGGPVDGVGFYKGYMYTAADKLKVWDSRMLKGGNSIINSRFVPFEDLVGVGTSTGFSSIVVPGSGVPFYDTFESNPFETKKQKTGSIGAPFALEIASRDNYYRS
ncbi:unnamed protein product [Sphagnum balticum]